MRPASDQRSMLTLLVLRCEDIERSRVFYETLGLSFAAEQHESGPRHYSTTLGCTVLELYSAKVPATGIRFGIGVIDVAAALSAIRVLGGHVVREQNGSAVVRDPDANLVELTTVVA